MRGLRIIGGAGALVAAALIGGTLVSATLAADDEDLAPPAGATAVGHHEYVALYLDTLADELGVDRDALGPAALAAANAAIDAAVADGRLDEERAEQLKERLASLQDPAVLLVRPLPARDHLPRFGPGALVALGNVAEAAADALGVDVDDVIAGFRAGQGLEEQAEALGVDYADVTAAVLEAARTELADEVADGDISQERAERMLERLETWLENGGEAPRHAWRHRGRAAGR